MATYRIRIIESVSRTLLRMDRAVGRRIASRIACLSEHLDEVHPTALTGDLSGSFKFRVGDYRIIYSIIEDEQVLVI